MNYESGDTEAIANATGPLVHLAVETHPDLIYIYLYVQLPLQETTQPGAGLGSPHHVRCLNYTWQHYQH